MSLQRAAAPLASVLRFLPISPSTRPAANQLCSRCLRNMYQRQAPNPSQRRCLATAIAYHPQTLETHPPPRNVDVPDTSIAGGQPHNLASAGSSTSPVRTPNLSLREGEAQISKPTSQASATMDSVATPEPAPSSNAKPQRRPKLRARKAAMTLTPSAVAQLREILSQPEPKLIRVGVKNRGCSGLAYHLEYVEKQGTFDEAVEQEGVKVLIDSKALFSIIGSEMDWIEDKLNRRFVFKNPNITEQCGCGESFSIG